MLKDEIKDNMETEELRLLRENNQMLKEIIWYLKNSDNKTLDFLINVIANQVANRM